MRSRILIRAAALIRDEIKELLERSIEKKPKAAKRK